MQNKLPSNRGMIEMNKKTLVDRWNELSRCLSMMVNFMERNKIFDRKRLPTNAVLGVVAASYNYIPDTGDL